MPTTDPTAERLEEALARLEAEVELRLRGPQPDAGGDLAEITAERDALRAAVDAAGDRIDRTIDSIRALLEGGEGHG
jgi:hypothetical protein